MTNDGSIVDTLVEMGFEVRLDRKLPEGVVVVGGEHPRRRRPSASWRTCRVCVPKKACPQHAAEAFAYWGQA